MLRISRFFQCTTMIVTTLLDHTVHCVGVIAPNVMYKDFVLLPINCVRCGVHQQLCGEYA